MNKPKDCHSYPFFILNECVQEVMIGSKVIFMFYNQGIWKEHHIPKELVNWVPENNVKYKVWYHHSDPADPADSGEYYLDYIEEI